jgi:hypothetical protein
MTAAAMLVALTTSVPAQQRVSLDLRAPAATPTGKLAGADLGTGIGIGGTVAFRLLPHLHLYGGWDYLHFTSEQSFAGVENDFEETGYTFGLRFQHPRREGSALSYRIEAGGTYKHVEVEDHHGDLIVDSGHSFGYEGGLGLVFDLGSMWQLVPMARFRSLSPEFEMGSSTYTGNLRYVGLEIGAARRF